MERESSLPLSQVAPGSPFTSSLVLLHPVPPSQKPTYEDTLGLLFSASGGTHADHEGRIRMKKTEESGVATFPTASFLWAKAGCSLSKVTWSIRASNHAEVASIGDGEDAHVTRQRRDSLVLSSLHLCKPDLCSNVLKYPI